MCCREPPAAHEGAAVVQTIEQIRESYASSAGRDFHAAGRFAITSCTTREGKGGTFATVELRDPSGSLVARCFDGASIDRLLAASAIEARLRINEFNGSMSAVLQDFQSIELAGDELLRFAGLDAGVHAERVQQLEAWIRECEGTIYGDVLRECFAESGTWEQFCLAPAAVRMHHAEPGGLVRHLVEVGRAGIGLLDSTGDAYDRPYFLAGVFLHDLGKLDTYTAPPTIQYTAQGQLAEHQIFSTFRLGKACARVGVPASVEAKLIHMIEQAHGAFRHAEWQDPLGAEVKALATADFFSSRLGATEKERKAQELMDRVLAGEQPPTAVVAGSGPAQGLF